MVHGTTYALWPVICRSLHLRHTLYTLADLACSLIAKEGLKKMTRNHIHCAVGLSGDKAVTSGMFKVFVSSYVQSVCIVH